MVNGVSTAVSAFRARSAVLPSAILAIRRSDLSV